jgi:hypothetical protein
LLRVKRTVIINCLHGLNLMISVMTFMLEFSQLNRFGLHNVHFWSITAMV